MRALRQLIGARAPKNINEIIRESIKLRSPLQHFATVIISDHGIVKGITQSKPNNLINDNFGLFLAALMRAPTTAVTTQNLVDIDGVTESISVYNVAGAFNNATSGKPCGTEIKVGAGTTSAARDDYDIETAFIVAPEDALFDSGTGSYAVGAISVAGAITAGGAGTINETAFFAAWLKAGVVPETFMLFHDILTAGEAFVLGNTITVAYTVNL